jgi:chloramphenicol-sensitive protein RarD
MATPSERVAAAGDSREGLLYGAGAFALWGLYPFYFKALAHVSPLEIVLHRILWSAVLLAVLIHHRRAWPEVWGALRDRRLRRVLFGTTLLIATNWFAYVVAVTGGQVLDASLGYFMCPLVSVGLGVLVLKERLSRLQLVAIAMVAAAVAMIILASGIVPRMALFLAVSFGLYGLFRKRLPVAPLPALTIECALLLPVAVLVAAWLGVRGDLTGPVADPAAFALLLLAGVVTVGPLLLFGLGAKRLRLSTVGLLQYIAPSLLFLEGIFWFGEPLEPTRLAAFAVIWAALLLYSADNLRRGREAPA